MYGLCLYQTAGKCILSLNLRRNPPPLPKKSLLERKHSKKVLKARFVGLFLSLPCKNEAEVK